VSKRVLVIGYGNTLRTDDGAGRRIAERLAADERLAGATVIQTHQLAPELALDISAADVLVLVDAGSGPPAGSFTIDVLQPAGRPAATPWSHHLEPAGLVALAGALYGHVPTVHLVTVGIESVDVGDRVSPAVEAVLPRVVDAIAALVAGPAAGTPVA
jgi:hydrogenase maturation protease